MTRAQRMEQLLREKLNPTQLRIVDDSEKHRGHGGWREGGETHFTIEISSEMFKGQSRVAIHRQIQAYLKPEFDQGLHALSIKLL